MADDALRAEICSNGWQILNQSLCLTVRNVLFISNNYVIVGNSDTGSEQYNWAVRSLFSL
jgi:hypothetical protein